VERKLLRTDVEIAAPVVNNVDILGINYGVANWDKLHATYPDKPFVGSETATINTTRGAVVRDNERCQIPLDYDSAKGESTWKKVAENDYCMGMFAWTGFDYFGEPTPFTYPAILTTFGIMDVCGFPKYPYYYYRANWREDIDTFELCPHWNYVAGGERRKVYLFSKCDEAELFVNGVSKGRVKIAKYSHAEWEVDFEAGEITAVGYKGGVETNRKTLKTTGAVAELRAEIDHVSVDENKLVRAIVKLSALDGEGRVVPTSEDSVKLIMGEGVALVGAGNGNPICHENPRSATHSLFGGLAQVIVSRDVAAGGGKATFAIDGIGSTTIEF
jgi:beta-galactosidase